MVRTNWFNPFVQVGREIGIELRMSFHESRLGSSIRTPGPLVLPEQRGDDRQMVEQRKAELVLQSVRHGAVRR